MPAPGTALSPVFPDWTNLQDTWRDIDAEWLRNRSVMIFPDTTTRGTAIGANTVSGMMSAVQANIVQTATVPGGPDFYNGSAWESVRYPNLNVISDATSVTLRRAGAGSGVQLFADNSVNIATLVAGTGLKANYTGSLLDATGIALKVGAKTVKLATDGAGLLVDSPVAITGTLSTSGLATLNSLTVTGATTLGALTTGAITAASLTATGVAGVSATAAGATITAVDAQLATSGVYGQLKHRAGGTAIVGVGSDSTVSIVGTTVSINGTAAGGVTVPSVLNVNGQTNFVGRPVFHMGGGTVDTWVAGIYAVQGNVAPTQNCPDGTIYITY